MKPRAASAKSARSPNGSAERRKRLWAQVMGVAPLLALFSPAMAGDPLLIAHVCQPALAVASDRSGAPFGRPQLSPPAHRPSYRPPGGHLGPMWRPRGENVVSSPPVRAKTAAATQAVLRLGWQAIGAPAVAAICPFSKAAGAFKLRANRNQRKGGDPMSSGILHSAMPRKLDHALVGAASCES